MRHAREVAPQNFKTTRQPRVVETVMSPPKMLRFEQTLCAFLLIRLCCIDCACWQCCEAGL